MTEHLSCGGFTISWQNNNKWFSNDTYFSPQKIPTSSLTFEIFSTAVEYKPISFILYS